MIDGTRDGRIDITDVTPIAENFLAEVARWIVEVADSSQGEFNLLTELDFTLLENEHRRMEVEIQATAGKWVRVIPVDSGGNFGEPSNVVQVPEAPPSNIPPVAVGEVSPREGDAPLVVSFDGSGSYDIDGRIVKWEWDFGMGIFRDYTQSQGVL